MKAWCFWISLTLCCALSMPLLVTLFVARSRLPGSLSGVLRVHRRGASPHAR